MPTWLPGDIGASSSLSLVDRLIQLGQRIHGQPDYKWNHIFIVVDDSGGIIEAGGKGVVRGNVSSHATTLNLSNPADRAATVKYATNQLGTEYGYTDIALLALDCLTGFKLSWRGDSVICSELAVLALQAAGWPSPYPPAEMMPADVVKALQAT